MVLGSLSPMFPDPKERTRALSVFGAVTIGGAALGLPLGGALTELLSWHWIFFINIPIGVATFVAGTALIEENTGIGFRAGLDIGGAVLSTAGLMLAVYAIVSSSSYGWHSPHTLSFGAAAIVTLAFFVLLESRLANPMMPIKVMRSPGLLSSSLIRGLMVVGMYSTFFIGVLYFQHVLGYDPIRTGLAFLPQTLSVALMSSGLTARIMNRLQPKFTALTGLATLGGGLVLLISAGVGTAYFPLLFVALLLIGLGASMAFTPLLTIALAEVPAKDAGIGSGIVNVSQQVSAALSVAVLGAVSSSHTASLLASGRSMLDALDGGYRLAFTIALASVVVGFALGLVLLKRPGSSPESHEALDQSEQAASETMIAEVL
jgi:MFS family permease